MNLATVRHVYCIGLGGVGVSAVAKYFLSRGATVDGSDPQKNPFVQDILAQGGHWFAAPNPDRLATGIDLVVYTDDAPADHPERQAAERLGIPCLNFSVVLGEMMAASQTPIAIGGTNGKSTTTAITSLLLRDAGYDPTIFVGSRIPELDSNFHAGQPEFLVAEADEYHDHCLNLRPKIAVITNIEHDHVDYFPTLDRLVDTFRRFASLAPEEGAVIVNADDPVVTAAGFQHPHLLRFGFTPSADLIIEQLEVSAGQQKFTLRWQGQPLGPFILHRPGQFNVMNAAAAVTAALVAGISPATFGATLARFQGIWRRFEVLNPGATVTVVNDYAHHPTAVAATIRGAKEFYPGRRILAVFQPHHRHRLQALFDGFVTAFDQADETMLMETYAVPGREHEQVGAHTTHELAERIGERGRPTTYVATLDEADRTIRDHVRPGDVILIMGAGPIWTLAQPLAADYV